MVADENKRIMANNIKRHMERKGVTNQQVCDALGFKYTTFMDWIKGVTYPRMPKVEAMANYFGVLKSDLIEEKTEERAAVQKKSGIIADTALRMKTDKDFMSVVEMLLPLDAEKISDAKQMLSIMLK